MEEVHRHQNLYDGMYGGNHNHSNTDYATATGGGEFDGGYGGGEYTGEYGSGGYGGQGHHDYGSTTSLPQQAGGIAGATNPFEDNASETHVAPAGPQYQRFDPPWYVRRWFLTTLSLLGILGLVLIFVLLYPFVGALAQHILNIAELYVDSAVITNPTNTSFDLALQGSVFRTSIFYATIHFNEPLNVSWVDGVDRVVPLGYFSLQDIVADHGKATLRENTKFYISNETAFGEFTQTLISSKNFTWRLECNSMRVQAAKFPPNNGLKFKKDLTLAAINNFEGNIILQNLVLPAEGPQGGIEFQATTILTNPSPFAVALGDLTFNLSYQGMPLGQGTSKQVSLVPGNNSINLSGELTKKTSASDLANLSTLFTNYLNGNVSDVVATGDNAVYGDNGQQISWLSLGLKGLELHVPFKPLAPINPIKSVNIGTLGLTFTEATTWSPAVTSDSVIADIALPFGFPVSISNIQNSFKVAQNGSTVAALTTPLGSATSSIKTYSSVDTHGIVNITLPEGSSLTSSLDERGAFSAFTADFLKSNMSTFFLTGKARAVTTTPVGTITLDPIYVNVSTSLAGLNGLRGLIAIQSVDVLGGTKEALNLAIVVQIQNPSQLILKAGDVSLQLEREGEVLGSASLANLSLALGNNTVNSTSAFNPNAGPLGQDTLNSFVAGKDVSLSISGYPNSTRVASLLQAFESLNVSVLLPGLKIPLISGASLIVLPTTGKTDNISHATVDLVNPFSTELKVGQITSTVSSFGLNLGSINTNANIVAPGGTTTTSPTLDLDLNFDPSTLFTLTRKLAVQAGEDTTQLDGIVELGGYHYLDTASSKRSILPRANIYTDFNLPNFITATFKNLKGDVNLTAEILIGEYTTSLTYVQQSVPVHTDSTILNLINVLALPIVQKLVGDVELSIDQVLISNPSQTSFGTSLTGAIRNAGPFDAAISFPNGLSVSWNGAEIGTIKLGDIQVVGDVGATLDQSGQFTVTNVDHLTDFTKTLLTAETFEWQVSATGLSVNALGITVPGVDFPAKIVSLRGFNGLKNAVNIQSFDLPYNDPAGGIHLDLETTVTNPSQVGITLSSISFEAFFQGTDIGAVSSTGGVTLTPSGTSALALSGRLIPQSSSEGLAAVSALFNKFIQGEDSAVSVTGTGAGPSDVTWLNAGIRSLSIDTVLPNQGKLNVIKSVSLNQLTIDFTESTAYSPLTSSSNTEAAFTLPFQFPVDITQLGQKITTGSDGQNFGTLDVPQGNAKTDVNARTVNLSFSNVPLVAFAQDVFRSFLSKATLETTTNLQLSGAATATAQTGVGTVTLSNIDFNVESTLPGLQGLKARPLSVSNLDVKQGYSDYLLITIDTQLYNPSTLTVGTGDVSFVLEFQGATLGTVELPNLVITPGEHTYKTNVRYNPQGSAVSAGEILLANYVQGIDSDSAIRGTRDSTPIDSLKDALAQISISPVTIPAIHENLIVSASLQFPTDVAQTGIASTEFTLKNPFSASINLQSVKATVTYGNLNLGGIDTSLSFQAPGKTSSTSDAVPFKFNLDSNTIISLILAAATANKVDLGPLLPLFADALSIPPGSSTSITSSVDPNPPTCVSGNEFPFQSTILSALENLQVDIKAETSLKIDDYPTSLSFTQKGVVAQVDSTALYLIGAVAPPIVNFIVGESNLAVKSASVSNLRDDGFDIALVGSLTNLGPLDASIVFVDPLTVTWEGHQIATIQLPPACAAADVGIPNYTPKGTLKIIDLDQFTNFAIKLLATKSFTWTVSTKKLRVNALGTIFENVALSKDITLNGFNNLPGVTIGNFELPGDSPEGGISISVDANIPVPAQLGIALGNVEFEAYYKGVAIGPLTGTDLTLPPSGNVTQHLTGRLVPQSGEDLDVIGDLFSAFLKGETVSLITKGVSVVPTGSNTPISWLSAAFKTLNLPVSLTGKSYDVIKSISISDFGIELINQAESYAPPSSSSKTLATYANPFAFSLQVIQSAVNITLGQGGTKVATLSLPKTSTIGGVSTGNDADLPISFSKVPLVSVNDAAFQQLLKATTLDASVDLELSGSADVVATTSIGNVPISGIPFTNVKSTLKAINRFNGVADLGAVVITGSGGTNGNEYVAANVSTVLTNPSDISLATVDTALPVFYKGVQLGRAAISPFNLIPGKQSYDTIFQYMPKDRNDTDAQAFLTEFISSTSNLDVEVRGDAQSSPFTSLGPALEGINLKASIPALGISLITGLSIKVRAISEDVFLEQAKFTLRNPFPTPIHVSYVQGEGATHDQGNPVIANFSQAIDFSVPANSEATSDFFDIFLLLGPVGTILSGYDFQGPLLVRSFATVTVGGTTGYEIPWLNINQDNLIADFDINVGLGEALRKLSNSSISSTPAASTSATSATLTASAAPKSGSSVAAAPPSSAAVVSATNAEKASAAPISTSATVVAKVQVKSEASPTSSA